MTIAFISNLGGDEVRAWCVELARLLPADTIVSEPAAAERDAIEVAVVADPPPGALAGMSGLRLVHSAWAGVDRLLADTTLPAHVPLVRLVDPAMAQAMVETVLAHVLGLHRQLHTYAAQARARRWQALAQPLATQRTVGVLGLGALGRACVRHLTALGFAVEGWSRRPTSIDAATAHSGPDGLHAVLSAADILVNLLPLTTVTEGILDADAFARMPAGASIVNVGRGAHIVDDDLLAALDAGHLSHAVLDVFRSEPLPADHPFWTHPCVSVLPHVAADTQLDTAAAIVADNIGRHRAGLPLTGLVDRARGY